MLAVQAMYVERGGVAVPNDVGVWVHPPSPPLAAPRSKGTLLCPCFDQLDLIFSVPAVVHSV